MYAPERAGDTRQALLSFSATSHEDHWEPQRKETRWQRRGLKFSELIVKSDCL